MAEITKVDTRQLSDFRTWLFEIPFDVTSITITDIDPNTKQYVYASPTNPKTINVYEAPYFTQQLIVILEIESGKRTQVLINPDMSAEISVTYI